MNKKEFLKKLSSFLENMPNSEKKDIISEYEILSVVNRMGNLKKKFLKI